MLWRIWHRRLGLGALALLLLAGLTGSLLAYKKELVRLLIAPEAALPAQLEPADLAPELDRIAGRYDPADRALIKAPNPEEPYWTLTGADGRVRLLATGSLMPYTRSAWLLPALELVRHLHTKLLAGFAGESVLLATGLIGVVLTIIGAILWWPSRARCRWRRVRPTSLTSPLLLQHHRHFGAVLAIPLLLSMVTGSVMLWQKIVGPLVPPPAAEWQDSSAMSSAPASRFLLEALARVPDGWPTYIRLGVPGSPAVSIRLRLPGEWHPNGRSSVRFETDSSRMRVIRADRQPLGQRLLNQAYPLHAGYGLPELYSLLVAVTGFGLCWLALSGASSWLRNRRKTTRRALFADLPLSRSRPGVSDNRGEKAASRSGQG